MAFHPPEVGVVEPSKLHFRAVLLEGRKMVFTDTGISKETTSEHKEQFGGRIYFFLRNFIFKKTLFEKLQYLKQKQYTIDQELLRLRGVGQWIEQGLRIREGISVGPQSLFLQKKRRFLSEVR